MQKNIEILQELQSIGLMPHDIEMPKMEMPENYFEHFNATLHEAIETETFLETLPKTNPFEVPQHYFEAPMNKFNSHKNNMKATWIKPLAIAASMALIIGTGFYFLKNKNNTPNYVANNSTTTVDTIFTPTEAEHYVLENIDDFEAEQNELAFEPIKKEIKTPININTLPINDVKAYIEEQDLNDLM
jgi:hypothetical protein